MIFTANPDGSPALAEPMTKTCRVCARALPLERMTRHKRGRYGRSTICRECDRAARAARRAARLEAGLCTRADCDSPPAEGRGGRCDKHADENSARAAAWRAADPEKARERGREYARARLARLSARSDAELEADLARVLAESPDGLLPCRAGHRAVAEDFGVDRSRLSGRKVYCRSHAAESYARYRRAPHLPSWEDRDLHACTYCGAEYEHADHLHARRNGGPDVSLNLAPACARCNLEKNATPVDEWLDRLAAAGDPRGVAREVWAAWPRVYLAVLEDGTVVDVETGEVVEEGAA